MKITSGKFWSTASWAAVIIHAAINVYYYLAWVAECARQAAMPEGGQWFPTTFDIGWFFGTFQTSLILIMARALDFNFKSQRIFAFWFTLLLIGVSIWLGQDYSNDPQHGDIVIAFGMFPLAILLTLIFSCFTVANIGNYSILGLQKFFPLLSTISKALTWLPLIWYLSLPPYTIKHSVDLLELASLLINLVILCCTLALGTYFKFKKLKTKALQPTEEI